MTIVRIAVAFVLFSIRPVLVCADDALPPPAPVALPPPPPYALAYAPPPDAYQQELLLERRIMQLDLHAWQLREHDRREHSLVAPMILFGTGAAASIVSLLLMAHATLDVGDEPRQYFRHHRWAQGAAISVALTGLFWTIAERGAREHGSEISRLKHERVRAQRELKLLRRSLRTL